MVDLHTHILPHIDDGASSFEEALDMLKLMIENGVTTVVATPHFNFEKNDIDEFIHKRKDSMVELKTLSNEDNLPIRILSGAELMFTPNLDNYDLNEFTIEETDYLLIELSTRRNEPDLESTLSAIIANGYIPILAHIERYSYLIQNSQRLVELIDMGVIMQINAKSLYSKKDYPFIKKMMSNNLVHIISSDAHDMQKRKPNMKLCELEPKFIDNQCKIIENKIIDVNKSKKMILVFGRYL